MLRRLADREERQCVSMDDPQARDLTNSDSKLFLCPLLLRDEAQKAPGIFESRFCVTIQRSARPALVYRPSEQKACSPGGGFAGRACLCAENVQSVPTGKFLAYARRRNWTFLLQRSRKGVGSFLRTKCRILYEYRAADRRRYRNWMRSSSYGQSCLMRGAVDDNGITGTEGFRKFLRTRAAIIGQLVNYQDLALAAGVSGVTAKEGVKVFQPMGIIQLLELYSASGLKRLFRIPGLYFCDTGLCAYLCSWTERDVLMHGAAGRTPLRKSWGGPDFPPLRLQPRKMSGFSSTGTRTRGKLT